MASLYLESAAVDRTLDDGRLAEADGDAARARQHVQVYVSGGSAYDSGYSVSQGIANRVQLDRTLDEGRYDSRRSTEKQPARGSARKSPRATIYIYTIYILYILYI